MAMITPPADTETVVRPNRDESISQWIQRNSRSLSIAATVVGVLVLGGGGGYWFYTRSVEITNANADRALTTALQSVRAQNAALAQSDLQKVIDRYSDTQSGIEAGMTLAEMDFEAGKTETGVALLEKLAQSHAAALSLSSIYSLMGDGQLQANKAAFAANAYQQAADAAKYGHERAWQLAKEARALTAAGDMAGARKVWEGLVTNPVDPGITAEAKVRLGELNARPAVSS